MNDEQLQIAAKEFCKLEDWLVDQDDIEMLAKFAQSLIDKGKMVEASDLVVEKAYGTGMDSLFRNRISELEKEVQHLRDNAFQSGDVKSLDLDNDVLVYFGFEEVGRSYFHPKMSGLYLSKPYVEAKHYLVKSNGQDKLTSVSSVNDLIILYKCITGENHPQLKATATQVKEISDTKKPAYDLLLASYNDLKAENNKQALEINRLMSGQKVISDEWIRISDRLPNPAQLVFLYNSGVLLKAFRFYPKGHVGMPEDLFFDLNDKEATTLEEVTHWMPVPSYPHEGIN